MACRWNPRGFGFIRPDEGGDDLFCHASSIQDGDALTEGMPVQFVKSYDAQKQKDRAIEVTGGHHTGGGGGAP